MAGPPWRIRKIISKGDYNYALVPEHPHATKNGYVLEHRVVMENELGRLLLPSEIVHHRKEREKKNNVISNLQVKTGSVHSQEHGFARGYKCVQLRCPGCKNLFDRQERETHLVKGGRYTCCSRSCSGFVKRCLQLGQVEMLPEIEKNVVRRYRAYRNAEVPARPSKP